MNATPLTLSSGRGLSSGACLFLPDAGTPMDFLYGPPAEAPNILKKANERFEKPDDFDKTIENRGGGL